MIKKFLYAMMVVYIGGFVLLSTAILASVSIDVIYMANLSPNTIDYPSGRILGINLIQAAGVFSLMLSPLPSIGYFFVLFNYNKLG